MHTIGIDFGTSKTLVSHINPQTNAPEPIKLGRDSAYLPTSVYIDTTGQFFFGDDAEDMIEEPSGCYLRGFKMQLGSATPLHMYLNEGKPCIITAKELVKEYLRHIREQVQQLVYHGEPVTMATITRPVKFSPAQCEELKQAAHDAGFNTVALTTEPEAAGLAFCRMNAAQAFKRSALIVDWGGGTLDFALVTREGDTIHTHSALTDGDTTMGGEKFDELLWMYAEQSTKQHGVVGLNPTTQLPKVRRAKEQLSSRNDVSLRLSTASGICPPINITRTGFNQLIEPDINKAAEMIQALLERIPAENTPEMLLLVGGCCKIPYIKKKLETICELPALGWHYSREAVAMGAALWKKTPAASTTQQAPTASNNHYELILSDIPDKVQLETILQKLSINLSNEELEKMKASLPGILMTSPTPEPLNKALDTIRQFGAGAYITSPLSCRLRAAIEANDIPLIRDVLQQGADLHAPYVINDNEGLSSETPLSHAAYKNLAEVVDLLFQSGAHIHLSTTVDGRTPLLNAAIANAADVITNLLEGGSYIHAKGQYGSTPLHAAAFNDAATVLPILLNHGANLHEKNNDGWTSLHWAAQNDAATVLPILLNHGATLHAKANDGRTPLHWAVMKDSATVLPILLNHGANLHEKDNDGWTPLHAAAANDAAKVLPILLNHGANLHEKANNGWTPLHAAAANDAATVLPIPLNHRANLHEKDNDGWTPLHWAAQNDAATVLPILLNHGANLHEKSNEGLTPLHTATAYDAAKVLPILLNHGANLHEKANNGWTPLHAAAANDAAKVLPILLNHGANVNEKNNEGLTPLHLAVLTDSATVLPILLNHGANLHEKDNEGLTPLHLAVITDSATVLPILLNHGANVNEKNNEGLTLLHLAVMTDSATVLPILLNHGANVNEKDNEGWTPLHSAAFKDSATVLPILLNHGANLHEKNNNGWTPLHWAAFTDSATVLPILLNHGANVNEKDNEGWTPLDYATAKKSSRAISLLRKAGAKKSLTNNTYFWWIIGVASWTWVIYTIVF